MMTSELMLMEEKLVQSVTRNDKDSYRTQIEKMVTESELLTSVLKKLTMTYRTSPERLALICFVAGVICSDKSEGQA